MTMGYIRYIQFFLFAPHNLAYLNKSLSHLHSAIVLLVRATSRTTPRLSTAILVVHGTSVLCLFTELLSAQALKELPLSPVWCGPFLDNCRQRIITSAALCFG